MRTLSPRRRRPPAHRACPPSLPQVNDEPVDSHATTIDLINDAGSDLTVVTIPGSDEGLEERLRQLNLADATRTLGEFEA